MTSAALRSAGTGGWLLIAAVSGLLLSTIIVAIADLPGTWAIFALIGAVSLAAIVWAGDPRDTLLAIFLVTVPIEISKALTSEASAYSPTLSLFLSDIAFVPLMILWGLDRLVGAPRARWSSVHTVATAMLAWTTISAAISISSVSWSILLNLIKYSAYLFVVGDLTREPRRLRIALASLAVGAGLQFAMVALQMLTGSDLQIRGGKNTDLGRLLIFEQGGGLHFRRPSGFASHPNMLSDYLTFLLPPLVCLAFIGRSIGWVRYVVAALLLATLVALVLALSRGGWIAGGVSVAFILAVGWYRGVVRPWHVGSLAVFGMLGLLVISAVFPAAIYRVVLSDQRSSDSRIAMMDQAFLIIQRHPVVGVGLGGYNQAAQTNIPASFAGLLPAFRDTLLKGVVHNKYLETFSETGIVGIGFLLAFLGTLICLPLWAFNLIDLQYWALQVGLAGAVVAQAVFFLFDHFSFDTRVGLLYVAAALMIGINDQLRRASEAACVSFTSTPTISTTR